MSVTGPKSVAGSGAGTSYLRVPSAGVEWRERAAAERTYVVVAGQVECRTPRSPDWAGSIKYRVGAAVRQVLIQPPSEG